MVYFGDVLGEVEDVGEVADELVSFGESDFVGVAR